MGYLNLHANSACVLGTSGHGRRAKEAFYTCEAGIDSIFFDDISWKVRWCWWCWKACCWWCGDGSSVDGDRRDNGRKDDVLELHFEDLFEEKKSESIRYM